MCRTGGRRCEHNWTQEQKASRNAHRRTLYASQKTILAPNAVNSHTHAETALTPAQIAYFTDSKVVDSNNQPITLYHGSSVEFQEFNPTSVGKGNDAWGNGYYFTDQEQVAKGYAVDSGSPTANVKEFHLNLTNPIYVDGKENMSLVDHMFPKKTVANLLKKHPEAYIQPNDADGNISFLGDFSPTYWDKEEHTREEINRMIDEVVEENYQEASWVELENLFGKEHGSAFLKALHEETGNDGVIVDFGEEGKHYVAWFPEQMKLTSNLNPQNNTKF
jgi:hypothetical protein